MRYARLNAALAALVLAGLACALPASGTPTPRPTLFPVSTEAAGKLVGAVKTAVADAAESGDLSLTLTEEELTSYAALKLANQNSLPLTEPQVHLQAGQIEITGQTEAAGIAVPVDIVLTPGIGADGSLTLAVEKADLGPLPLPASLLTNLTTTLNELLTKQAGGQVLLTEVSVADGQMTLTGTLNK